MKEREHITHKHVHKWVLHEQELHAVRVCECGRREQTTWSSLREYPKSLRAYADVSWVACGGG